jgi:hypothetical protein
MNILYKHKFLVALQPKDLPDLKVRATGHMVAANPNPKPNIRAPRRTRAVNKR